MELCVVADRMFDRFVDILRRMFFQTDDAGAEHADAMIAAVYCTNSTVSVPASLVYCEPFPSRPSQTHDTPSAYELVHRVVLQHVGRAENVHRPRFVVLFDTLQELQSTLFVEQEILIHDKKGFYAESRFQLST